MIDLEFIFVVVGVLTVWRWGLNLIAIAFGKKKFSITLSWFGLMFVAGLIALIIDNKRKRKE